MEMVHDSIHGMMYNQQDPEMRQALRSIGDKISVKIESIQSPFEIEDMQFDRALNKMIDDWMITQYQSRYYKLRRATLEEEELIESAKVAESEQQNAYQSFYNWHQKREEIMRKLETRLQDFDGIFYAKGRFLRKKQQNKTVSKQNDQGPSNQKIPLFTDEQKV